MREEVMLGLTTIPLRNSFVAAKAIWLLFVVADVEMALSDSLPVSQIVRDARGSYAGADNNPVAQFLRGCEGHLAVVCSCRRGIEIIELTVLKLLKSGKRAIGVSLRCVTGKSEIELAGGLLQGAPLRDHLLFLNT